MNSSKLKQTIYSYLGFHGVGESPETDALIEACLAEVGEISAFRYRYKALEHIPEFLQKPPYTEYLAGSSGVLLSVMTLGAEVDRRVKLYSRTDLKKSVVFDAVASAYLEEKSDEYERGLEGLSYRFCPGYGGSSVTDLKYIFEILQPEKIGITLTENFYMLPGKTMAGVLAVGGTHKKQCGACVLREHCAYRKEGKRCYGSEEK